jgi:hypothetical protein
LNFKKLAILVILAIGAYQLLIKFGILSTPKALQQVIPTQPQPANFKCDGRVNCSQMTSYEEAKFFLQNCPNTKMDGDHDGEACERQF